MLTIIGKDHDLRQQNEYVFVTIKKRSEIIILANKSYYCENILCARRQYNWKNSKHTYICCVLDNLVYETFCIKFTICISCIRKYMYFMFRQKCN